MAELAAAIAYSVAVGAARVAGIAGRVCEYAAEAAEQLGWRRWNHYG